MNTGTEVFVLTTNKKTKKTTYPVPVNTSVISKRLLFCSQKTVPIKCGTSYSFANVGSEKKKKNTKNKMRSSIKEVARQAGK